MEQKIQNYQKDLVIAHCYLINQKLVKINFSIYISRLFVKMNLSDNQNNNINFSGTAEEIVKRHLYQPNIKELDSQENLLSKEKIKQLLTKQNAVLIAHYYTHPLIQSLAEETGGIVSDSLEMARFGADHPTKTLIIAGVKFMGETAKILSPNKTVLMPTLEATCSRGFGL